jgi:hypothetical protein
MKTSFFFLIILFIFSSSRAQDNQNVLGPVFGKEERNSQFFRQSYLHNKLAHYLDNYSDYVTWQSETAGDFQLPDLQLFSITGNSYKWNKYDLNGFRVDNRFFPNHRQLRYPAFICNRFDDKKFSRYTV